MKRAEIIYNVKELLKEHTDDSLISDEHILFLFSTYRAKFLRQLYSDSAKQIDETSLQTLCLKTGVVDRGECGITVDCDVVRTVAQIPDLLSIKGRPSLIYVGPPIVGLAPYDIIYNKQINTALDDPFATTSVFIDNGYIYLAGKEPAIKKIKCLKIQALFQNPAELEGFTGTCGKDLDSCKGDKEEYPVPGHIVADITNAVVQEFLRTKNIEAYRDTDNDDVPNEPDPRQKR